MLRRSEMVVSEGLAFGYKYCKFYVFNRFTDQIKYQGEELTDDMKKNLIIVFGIQNGDFQFNRGECQILLPLTIIPTKIKK